MDQHQVVLNGYNTDLTVCKLFALLLLLVLLCIGWVGTPSAERKFALPQIYVLAVGVLVWFA